MCPMCWQVDDVVREHAVSINGSEAMHVLAISHPGFQLYPLDEDQAGLASKPLIAAAFVPVSSDDNSEEGSCDE